MKTLNEKRITDNIRLTNTQKKVMAIILSSPTEKLAADAISSGRSILVARDLLMKMGLIEYRDGSATVTEDGKDLLRSINIIDDSDMLTPAGEEAAQYGEEPHTTESLMTQIDAASRLV